MPSIRRTARGLAALASVAAWCSACSGERAVLPLLDEDASADGSVAVDAAGERTFDAGSGDGSSAARDGEAPADVMQVEDDAVPVDDAAPVDVAAPLDATPAADTGDGAADAEPFADGATTPPRAFADVSIAGASTGSCSDTGFALVLIGSADGFATSVVLDPASTLDTVDCQVVASDGGGGFDFVIDVAHRPQPDGQGSMLLEGHVGADGRGTNVDATFDLGRNEYVEQDCAIAPVFDATDGGVPFASPVAPGRVFGSVTCPRASQIQGSDLCSITADFALDGCRR